MNSLPHISTPLSEPWTAWVMLFLLLCLLASMSHQPGLIKDTWRSIFSKMERNYNESVADRMESLLLSIFRIGVLAMTMYVIHYHGGHFSLVVYALVVLCTIVMELVRLAMTYMVAYVFYMLRKVETPRQHYDSIWLSISMVLYPITLVMINWGVYWWSLLVLGLVGAVGVVLWSIKLFRMFMVKPMSILYIILYIMTIEVLPVGTLCWLVGYFLR